MKQPLGMAPSCEVLGRFRSRNGVVSFVVSLLATVVGTCVAPRLSRSLICTSVV